MKKVQDCHAKVLEAANRKLEPAKGELKES